MSKQVSKQSINEKRVLFKDYWILLDIIAIVIKDKTFYLTIIYYI